MSNENILINWDFRNPVNRRGQLSYTGVGETVDGWRNETAYGAMTVGNGVCTFAWNRQTTANYAALVQRIELSGLDDEAVCTWSILASGEGTVQIRGKDTQPTRLDIDLTNKAQLYTFSCPIKLDSGIGKFRIISDDEKTLSGSIRIYAAKLELGSVQTLAR